MYKVLLDSSSSSLSVGLSNGEELLDFISYEAWQSQSEHMIPELNKLLDKHNVDRKEIDGVVVSIGPGSYTGIRIGLTIAKVMSLILEVPVYPVSSLRVLKDGDKPSICLINARSNRSYFGVYKGNEVLVADVIKTNDEVREYISIHSEFSICGDARYLGLEYKDTNVCKQMVSLIPTLEKMEDSLGLKPVYMKD